ncbi:roadblock/LC7 domain-containing protein [Kineococcus sp. GCM10028916]|jgi:predicted regulator of Ras-like GTPase activity (Roadblock/LC7/MglB family)|uniref:roadblock/LC7 domain-containing protein n=1 Tax=unclassified Kineococcus TaxID=2621656 RepID=UPI002E1D3FC2
MSVDSQNLVSQTAQDVNFLLERFVSQTPGVEQAIGVSSDGLLMTMRADLDRADADKLAATVSGLTTLAVSASRLLHKGPLSQVITEFGQGYLLVSSIAGRACLGVVTAADCDLGLVGYETTMLVERVGALLTPELITELKTSLEL